jgi:diguanylate cyclase (GGDEF)-like protein
VLLVYMKEETREARKLVYGLALANAGLSIVSMIVALHFRVPGSDMPAGISSTFLQSSAWVAVVGTVLLLLDAIGIILVYEYISGFVRSTFLRTTAALVVIAAFDNLLFTLAVQRGPEVPALLLAGFVGKTAAAFFYAAALTLYLRWFEPQSALVGTGDVADVFQKLTYRQLYEQARTRMTRDALTELYNRGYFDEVLPPAVAQAQRYASPLSVMLVDVDHFKTINDSHNHLVGDRVLRLVAETLKEHARAADTVCRYGGDEFVVILSSADAESASAFAERFRRRLRDRARTGVPELGSLEITATVGIATLHEDPLALTPEDLLRLADNRLYMGKRAGRNQVVWRNQPAAS